MICQLCFRVGYRLSIGQLWLFLLYEIRVSSAVSPVCICILHLKLNKHLAISFSHHEISSLNSSKSTLIHQLIYFVFSNFLKWYWPCYHSFLINFYSFYYKFSLQCYFFRRKRKSKYKNASFYQLKKITLLREHILKFDFIEVCNWKKYLF